MPDEKDKRDEITVSRREFVFHLPVAATLGVLASLLPSAGHFEGTSLQIERAGRELSAWAAGIEGSMDRTRQIISSFVWGDGSVEDLARALDRIDEAHRILSQVRSSHFTLDPDQVDTVIEALKTSARYNEALGQIVEGARKIEKSSASPIHGTLIEFDPNKLDRLYQISWDSTNAKLIALGLQAAMGVPLPVDEKELLNLVGSSLEEPLAKIVKEIADKYGAREAALVAGAFAHAGEDFAWNIKNPEDAVRKAAIYFNDGLISRYSLPDGRSVVIAPPHVIEFLEYMGPSLEHLLRKDNIEAIEEAREDIKGALEAAGGKGGIHPASLLREGGENYETDIEEMTRYIKELVSDRGLAWSLSLIGGLVSVPAVLTALDVLGYLSSEKAKTRMSRRDFLKLALAFALGSTLPAGTAAKKESELTDSLKRELKTTRSRLLEELSSLRRSLSDELSVLEESISEVPADKVKEFEEALERAKKAAELADHAIDNLPGNVYLGPGTVVVVPEMEEVPEIGKYRALVDINEISKGMEMVERGISGLREVAGSPAKG